MRILAFDCATNTGWCVLNGGKVEESGVQSFAKRRGDSNGILFLRFSAWVNEMIGLVEPEVIAYEQAHFRGGSATEICVGLQTRVQEAAAGAGLPYIALTTSEVKKALVGRGSASKDDMVAAAKEILGRSPKTDDEADAIGVALAAAKELEF